jgi:hypothetical protein
VKEELEEDRERATRARRPDDWTRDLANAKALEAHVAKLLRSDPRVRDLAIHTDAMDKLDFAFRYRGIDVALDVKEKRQRYTGGFTRLWPEVDERDLFVLDETVYRRVVWRGGGGYLVVRDEPQQRWVVLGPWDITLGPCMRVGRWGRRSRRQFLKGKVLLDLSTSSFSTSELFVDLILKAIDHAKRWLPRVDPYPLQGRPTPEIGRA